jgi:hypothetical protein
VCLPIIVSISFATIDLCTAIFVKESLTIAAYEGARVGIQRSGTNQDVTNKIQEVLDGRGISYESDSITFSSPGFDTADTLEHVTVTVSVPCSSNLVITGGLFEGRSLEASVTLRKEFGNLLTP